MDITLLKDPFIITPEKLKEPIGLNDIISLSDGYIYTNKSDNIYTAKYENNTIYIIGYVSDIRDGLLSKKEIGKNLMHDFKEDSKFFIESLDYIGGRYIIIIDNSNSSSIYTDATGLKPLFYWENIFGSHEILLRELVNNNYSVTISKPLRRLNGYLDYSNSDGILKANPNYSYNISGKSQTRIYPRKNYRLKDSEEVFKEIVPKLEEQVKWLGNQDKKLYLSLTGGFDSKVTMALTKNIQEKITYFTYMRDTSNANRTVKWIYNTDKKIVDKINKNLNLNHKYMFIDDIEYDKKDLNNLSSHTTSNHSFKLALAMKKGLDSNSLHIKSTLYELGKVPFDLELENVKDVNKLYKVASKWKPKNVSDEESKKMYAKYLERNDLQKIIDYNYHLPFLIYWETRMGNWHSNITQETDLNQDTFVIINTRFILDNFISLKLNDRKDTTLFKKLINHSWPILNYFIPNSNQTLEDRLKIDNQNNIQSLNQQDFILTAFKNINISLKDNIYEISPLDNTLLKDEDHYLEVKNTSNKDLSLILSSFYQKAKSQILIQINEDVFDITNLVNSHTVLLHPDDILQIRYDYAANFDKTSWIEAGRLTLSIQ